RLANRRRRGDAWTAGRPGRGEAAGRGALARPKRPVAVKPAAARQPRGRQGIAKSRCRTRLWGMWVKLRLVLAAAAVSATAACSAAVDSGQARLCRAIIPALNAGSDIEVVRTGPLDAAGGGRGGYRLLTREGRNRPFLQFPFSPSPPLPHPT